MNHPYRNIPDRQSWARAMTWPAPGQVDPVAYGGPRVRMSDKIATLGSCFAQHISRYLESSGHRHYVTEQAPAGMPAEEAERRQYGLFSARYGNVYTVRQAVQLFERAFGQLHPADEVWRHGERFVDPYRPRVEPEGFASPEEVRVAASAHLVKVREMFSNCDWLVFTLGLTEAWRSRRDGLVYPLAPGVYGGTFDAGSHEFVNFTAREIAEDLARLVDGLHAVNPGARLILTVSPVPLVATYEPRHVWVSTTFSKAALRVAADEAERSYPGRVTYFPSYEIVTSPAAGGHYYADDLRQVTALGVNHVMRMFARHFLEAEKLRESSAMAPIAETTTADEEDVICDEEVIAKALKASGFPRP